MVCFFMLLRAVTLSVVKFLYLPVQVVLDQIASVVAAIKKKLVLIFDYNSLTVLDQTALFLSLHISFCIVGLI